MEVIINLDMDKKCSKCGKPGAMENGLCITCAVNIHIRKMKEKKT